MIPQKAPPGEEILGPYAFDRVIGRQGQNGPRMRCPMDVVVDDARGVLYAISRHDPRVGQWTLDGDFVADFGGLVWPSSIALGQEGLYITDEAPHRLQKFSLAGEPLGKWDNGNGHPGWRKGEFNRPSGIAVDGTQHVYVVDTFNHRVQKFRPDGTLIGVWGRQGSGPGELNQPWGLDIDNNLGRAYVADWRNDRVQVFSLDGGFLSTIGRTGDAPGELRRPSGIAVDPGGLVAVADWGNNRVQIFTAEGAVVAVLTGHGNVYSKVAKAFMDTQPGMQKDLGAAGGPHPLEKFLHEPAGLGFDNTGTLYIADTGRHRLQVYSRAA
jgi:DNA-binding beta-propeller fold protein YncE